MTSLSLSREFAACVAERNHTHPGSVLPVSAFSLREDLGSGRFGQLRIAEYSPSGQLVAIKRITSLTGTDSEVRVMLQLRPHRCRLPLLGRTSRGDLILPLYVVCWQQMVWTAHGEVCHCMCAPTDYVAMYTAWKAAA